MRNTKSLSGIEKKGTFLVIFNVAGVWAVCYLVGFFPGARNQPWTSTLFQTTVPHPAFMLISFQQNNSFEQFTAPPLWGSCLACMSRTVAYLNSNNWSKTAEKAGALWKRSAFSGPVHAALMSLCFSYQGTFLSPHCRLIEVLLEHHGTICWKQND